MAWLSEWARDGRSSQEAQAAFATLSPIDPSEIIGAWRGSELPTRHPLDGLLAAYGWWGKRFETADEVDPLIFEGRGDLVSVNPGRLPLSLAVAFPHVMRTAAAADLFRLFLPLLATSQPKARLRRLEWNGVISAAMIYDDLPIIDHFRRVDDHRLLGMMDFRRTSQPFFFQLTRAVSGRAAGRTRPQGV